MHHWRKTNPCRTSGAADINTQISQHKASRTQVFNPKSLGDGCAENLKVFGWATFLLTLYFTLENGRLTVLFQFQVVSKGTQPFIYTCIHSSPNAPLLIHAVT